MTALPIFALPVTANAVGKGPEWGGNGNITTAHLSTYDDLAEFLQKEAAKQPAMELTVIGQSVKGRDLYLAPWISDPAKPTILYLTQQHGNEQLATEGALEFIKHLGTGRGRDVLEGANILVVPMLNPDGAIGEEWVSGSILHPTTPNAPAELVERSKKLGAVVYESVEAKGWGKIAKYGGGSAETISRNGIAVEYGVATLLFEMRGMSDHYYESYVLGARSSGYLIRQTVLTLEEPARAIADGSIETADTSFWDTLPEQEWYQPDE